MAEFRGSVTYRLREVSLSASVNLATRLHGGHPAAGVYSVFTPCFVLQLESVFL